MSSFDTPSEVLVVWASLSPLTGSKVGRPSDLSCILAIGSYVSLVCGYDWPGGAAGTDVSDGTARSSTHHEPSSGQCRVQSLRAHAARWAHHPLKGVSNQPELTALSLSCIECIARVWYWYLKTFLARAMNETNICAVITINNHKFYQDYMNRESFSDANDENKEEDS